MYNYTLMSRKSQVLLATYFDLERGGGIATATVMLAQELKKRDYNVFIASTQDFGLEKSHQIPTLLLPSVRHLPSFSLRDQLLRERLIKIIRDHKIDILHATDNRYLGVPAVQATKECSIPLVQDYRDYWFTCLKGDLLFQNCDHCAGPQLTKCQQCLGTFRKPWTTHKYQYWQTKPTLLAQADLKFPVSQHVADQLIEAKVCTADDPTSIVIYDTIAPSSKEDATQKVASSSITVPIGDSSATQSTSISLQTLKKQNKFLVFFAGKLIYHRGIQTLLETARLCQKANPQITFLVAGDGEMKSDIFNFQKKYQLHNVILLGQIPTHQMRVFYQHVDLFYFPSLLHEPFSRSVLEAVFYNLPVVTSNLGGLKEIVRDGYNGFLIDPAQPQLATDKINLLAHKPALRKKMITANRQVRKKFSHQKYFDTLITHYDRLLTQYAHH